MFLSNSFLPSKFSRNPIFYLSSSVLNKTFVNLFRTFSVSNVRCSENSNVRIENQSNESVGKNHSSLHDFEVEDHFLDEESENIVESPRNSKILKATIIGNPNVGKSTLINQIVGRQIFAISSKVHTTRCRARAVYIQGSTQLVFLDTPGLVTGYESSKYNLEKSFLSDGESSIQEADIVGVVHDVSSDRYNDRLDPKVLRLLNFYPSKHTILIMNKIDCLRSKRVLLDIANNLTCFKLQNTKQTKSIREELKDEWSPKTEFSIDKAMKKQKGWPFFKEIFMVSALDGSGIGDIKEYLVQNAKPGDWLFPRNAFTDQTYIKMIEESVQARLLDNLPNEIPYNLTTQLEYYDRGRAGNVIAVVLVGCKTPRIEKLVMGPGGKRIRVIAKSAEQDLENTFRVPVKLRVVVTKKKEKTVSIDELIKSGSLDVLENN